MNLRPRSHRYAVQIVWTGNIGSGTGSYRGYERSHDVAAEGKATIAGSSDPVFRGDASRWNPEELLVSALASCHMLAYLHLCADAGVVVTAYADTPEGTMTESAGSGGKFTSVVLRPAVTVMREKDIQRATELHHQAHEDCFIARSVNFPVTCEPRVHA